VSNGAVPECRGVRTAAGPNGIHQDARPMVYRTDLSGWYCATCRHLAPHLTDYFRRPAGLGFSGQRPIDAATST
jgi:hypothetical protein